MFYLSQTFSKENILQKLDIELWLNIQNIILTEIQNKAAITIQKYYKKYLHLNFIPNLIKYTEYSFYHYMIPSQSFYNIINRFDNLNLKQIDCFNTVNKCKCCNFHISLNTKIKNMGFNINTINYVENLILNTTCKCECYIASTTYCIHCFEE